MHRKMNDMNSLMCRLFFGERSRLCKRSGGAFGQFLAIEKREIKISCRQREGERKRREGEKRERESKRGSSFNGAELFAIKS